MPRRITDYAVQYTTFNEVCTIGAFIFGFSQLLFLYNVLTTMFGKGERATSHVWEGAHGLEWTLSSPPPYHSFNTPPEITATVMKS